MDITFPDRYFKAVQFMEKKFGNLEATAELDNLQKLVFYALRKQAEVGPCNEPGPYMWHVKEKYKHDAWKQLKNMSKFEAMVHYVQHLDEIRTGWIQEVLNDDSSKAASTGAEADVEEDDLENLREPTADHIKTLIGEVRRLRAILKQHSIAFDAPSAESSSQKDSGVPATPPEETSTSAEPVEPNMASASSIVPPVKPVPSPDATAIPPTKPAVGTEGGAGSVKRSTSGPVYYTPKKLTWLEWLGIVSVDDVAAEQ